MARVSEYDVVIIGGGCAGLSLARELSRLQGQVKALVLEARAEYVNDRTWCFWSHDSHALSHIVSKSWSSWEISSIAGPPVVHKASDCSYQMIRGIDFYTDALSAIDSSPSVCLQTHSPVSGIRRDADRFEVSYAGGSVYARRVVDSRPPAMSDIRKATLVQYFIGREVEADNPLFNANRVGLMTDMRHDELGFRFVYLLPLDSRRALIETTRFSSALCSRRQLAKDLDADISALLKGEQWKVNREEYGALPMGMPHGLTSQEYVHQAGIAGGALRAATGYGFQHIQRWAVSLATSLSDGSMTSPPAPTGRFLNFMDDLFLQALNRHPEQAAEFFNSIAGALDGNDFASFMEGKAGLRTWSRVIRALPPRPFLSAMLDKGRFAHARAASGR